MKFNRKSHKVFVDILQRNDGTQQQHQKYFQTYLINIKNENQCLTFYIQIKTKTLTKYLKTGIYKLSLKNVESNEFTISYFYLNFMTHIRTGKISLK